MTSTKATHRQPLSKHLVGKLGLLGFLVGLLTLGGCANQHTTKNSDADPADDIVVAVDDNASTNDPDVRSAGDLDYSPHDGVVQTESNQKVGSLWKRIRSGMSLGNISDPRITRELNSYRYHPASLNRTFQRGAPFLHMIVQKVEARGMPSELALLPVVESGFRPLAYSKGHAAGMWQFIAATGSRFGLQQDWWYDGRRDALASTDAALDYLEYLHKRFDGNWLHALAAYNTGESNVERAIRENRRKGKSTSFWDLRLPKETRDYVPRLLAVSKLVAKPERYQLQLYPIADHQRIVQIRHSRQTDLRAAAKMAGLTYDQFKALNPGFKRDITPPKGPHHLVVPLSAKDALIAGLRSAPKQLNVAWDRHVVEPGDVLGKLAERYETSVAELKSLNKLRSNTIRIGQTLLIPQLAASTGAVAKPKANKPILAAAAKPRPVPPTRRLAQGRPQKPTSEAAKTHDQAADLIATAAAKPDAIREYIVRQGDTLWSIARRFQVKRTILLAANHLKLNDTLRIGMVLKIPGNASNRPSSQITLRATEPTELAL